MPHAIAGNANLCATGRALGPLAPAVLVYMGRGNPSTASLIGAVESVVCGKFLVLAIPLLLELHVEVRLYMTKRNPLIAALWRHLPRVLKRHLKGPLDAISAHVVAALERMCLANLDAIQTDHTLDAILGQSETRMS